MKSDEVQTRSALFGWPEMEHWFGKNGGAGHTVPVSLSIDEAWHNRLLAVTTWEVAAAVFIPTAN